MPEGFRYAPPQPGTMFEALRGLGYSVPTALADIIDNSIAAGASSVDIEFHWEGVRSWIAITDDGCGMGDAELERAMCLGVIDPLGTRAITDLGRFGLGLKTASLSQARRLTVASRRNAVTSCLRWDLDVLATSAGRNWMLLEGPDSTSSWIPGLLPDDSNGTVVVWENLDRVVPAGFTSKDFLDLIDVVQRHLAMVFHRFVEGPKPNLKIRINGRCIEGWDPFLSNHPATWTSPEVAFETSAGVVRAVGYVLPHRDRLTADQYERGAGLDGWTAQQGFYVYRNQRLLVAGGWLGLGRPRPWTKEEPTRLARIQLDLPNSADDQWKIDVRKSRARPPSTVKDRLSHFADDVRARARSVFAHRGQAVRGAARAPIVQAWRTERGPGGVRYRIDEAHAAIGPVLEAAGPLTPSIRAMLRVIEETVPVQRIWLDTAEARETPRTGFDAVPEAQVKSILQTVYRNLVVRKGYSPAEARAQLLRTDGFQNQGRLIAELTDSPANQE